MNKWLIAFVLGAVLLVVIGYHLLQKEMVLTSEQAVLFARQELSFRYKNASIEVFDVKNTSTVAGESWWLIRANVVYGKGTLCPNLTVVEVDQKYNFVPREKDLITQDCMVQGCRGVQYCSINYPEEAVLLSQDAVRNPDIQANLSRFIAYAGGPTKIYASATPYGDKFTTPLNNTYSNVWVASYLRNDTNVSFEVVLNQSSGIALESYTR